MKSEEIWIHCSCKAKNHIFCLSRDVYPNTDPEVEVSLQPFLRMHNSFWKRVYAALCYIFKWREGLGQFDNVYIEKDDARRIIKFLNESFPQEQSSEKPIIIFRERLNISGDKTIFDIAAEKAIFNIAAEKYASVLNCEKPTFNANNYEKSTYYYFPAGIMQLVRLNYNEFEMRILSRV